jgi:Tol biopolymer transport system component
VRTGLRTINANGTRGGWLRAGTNLASPDWSPDGAQIAAHAGTGRARLWVVDADGSNRRRVGSKGLVGERPRWSPDGRRIAFVLSGKGVVRVLDLRTGTVRTVFDEDSPYGQEYGLTHAWSPDGRWLAVMRAVEDDCVDDPTVEFCLHAELWIVSSTGAPRERVYTGPDHSSSDGLDWQP